MKLNKIIIGVSALLVAGAASAWAATTVTATVGLSGTVLEVTTIATSTGGPVSLGDPTGGIPNLSVATLTEKCNKKGGYTIQITSANHETDGTYRLLGGTTTEYITYTLTHNGDAFTKASDTKTYPKTGSSGITPALVLTVPSGNYSADTYTDTITITMSAP